MRYKNAFSKASESLFLKLNITFFLIFKFLMPINKKKLIFESEGDFGDNARALYQYMEDNHIADDYNIIWLFTNPEKFKSKKFNSVYKYIDKINWKLMYSLATSHFYFYDHTNMFQYINCKKRRGQKIVYLNHGAFSFKSPKGQSNLKNRKNMYDIILGTGPLSVIGNKNMWDADYEQTKLLGFPRNDYFFSNLAEIRKKIDSEYGINKYSKLILWMPTFRKSTSRNLSEEYFNNETGLPIIYSKKDLRSISTFMQKKNMLLILKLHHLQSNLPIYKFKFKNLLILRDSDLRKINVQLYQFIPLTDALITDYSSISIDYLLLDKPIVYTLDDFYEYKHSRGLYPENILDFFKGDHVYNIQELKKSLGMIYRGLDLHRDERKQLIKKFHTNVDGNSCERLLKYYHFID